MRLLHLWMNQWPLSTQFSSPSKAMNSIISGNLRCWLDPNMNVSESLCANFRFSVFDFILFYLVRVVHFYHSLCRYSTAEMCQELPLRSSSYIVRYAVYYVLAIYFLFAYLVIQKQLLLVSCWLFGAICNDLVGNVYKDDLSKTHTSVIQSASLLLLASYLLLKWTTCSPL